MEGDREIPREVANILSSSILTNRVVTKAGLPLGLGQCRNEHIMIKGL